MTNNINLDGILKKFEVRDGEITFHLLLLEEWLKLIPSEMSYELTKDKPESDLSVITITFAEMQFSESLELVTKLVEIIQDNIKKEIIVRKQLESMKGITDISQMQLDKDLVINVMSLTQFDYMVRFELIDLTEQKLLLPTIPVEVPITGHVNGNEQQPIIPINKTGQRILPNGRIVPIEEPLPQAKPVTSNNPNGIITDELTGISLRPMPMNDDYMEAGYEYEEEYDKIVEQEKNVDFNAIQDAKMAELKDRLKFLKENK